MANNRFNKQVSPKGYADGGIIPKNFKDLKPGVIDTAKKITAKKIKKKKAEGPTTRGYPCEQIHKLVIGLLPRKHVKSQHLITFPYEHPYGNVIISPQILKCSLILFAWIASCGGALPPSCRAFCLNQGW